MKELFKLNFLILVIYSIGFILAINSIENIKLFDQIGQSFSWSELITLMLSGMMIDSVIRLLIYLFIKLVFEDQKHDDTHN